MKTYASLQEIRNDLSSGAITVKRLVEYYHERILSHKDHNIFLETWFEEALNRADQIDQKIKAGKAGRLAGMVISIKDNLCYKGHVVTAGSKILGGFESLFTATALERILDEDVIIIGRVNCDEFAMGSSNENSSYGPVRNPLDPSRVPGGSSGGSVASVAADLCLASLGSDTGGSIRQPASFTGLVGFKPTYGRISRWGLIAYASSFDQIGPITRSPEDAALLYEIMAGYDPKDNTCSSQALEPVTGFHSPENKSYRIAYIEEAANHPGVDPEIREGFKRFLDKLREEGHIVEPVSVPLLEKMVPAYYVLTTAEASSNLARFDGVRYGYRSEKAGSVEEVIRYSRSEGFGPEVKRRIMLGTFVLSAGFFDAYYGKAQKVRKKIQEQTLDLLKKYDFILSPTSPSVAFKTGSKSDDPISMYLSDIFTVHSNLAGTPSISLPLGKNHEGLPWGIQLMGGFFCEKEIFGFSARLMSNPGYSVYSGEAIQH